MPENSITINIEYCTNNKNISESIIHVTTE